MDFADVEEESILTAIFKDAFPENWQSDPNFVQYLSELSSYGNLAFQNYTTFIQTAECSREIFQDRCVTTSPGNHSKRHTQLLEILELPQLMDTCVRNGYYDEALELAAHVKRLEKKHANIPIIASIVNEVRLSSQLMLNQLLQQLRSNVQLPACLRVIGYLRRMDVFTEVELRIKFLQVSQFLSTLEADLTRGVGGRLDSILGQCMYFGLSFSRGGHLYPPTVLLEFHPLAAYCNDLLAALNDLRLCAPIALVTEVTQALQGSAEETTFDAKERAKFEGFVSAYSTSLLPYMNKCLQALYPPTQLAQVLGVTVSEMNKMKERTDEPESGIKQDVAVIGSEELRTDDSPDIQSLVKDDILDSGVRESPEPETKAELNDMAANAVLSDITSEAEKKQTELEGIADIEEENNKEEKEHDENKVEVDKDDPVTDDHKKTSDRLTIPTVNFSLPSDTDEEETVDIDKLDTGDMNAAVDEDIGEIDIDRDLSAMAEDVLRAKKD
ncbi:COG8-like protein [Mya arenaria]|uniref:Conserved oligomeric Golgi complex subunit 8 n=1 Tax=Mya arenaria TaxID=6604 RepID=A0ABY7G7X4_MYAAR|nr:COG8-like protein [Mya arenaria]